MVWGWFCLARVRVHNCKVLTMERGRDGRRGGSGGGSLSAPRRPRTSGFKDAPVGEDGDDVTDDIHNLRMRERPKKESNSVNAVLGNTSGNVGSSSRNKRKRLGSQEFQGQARSTTADDLDETTEDTEMGVSEDDDDPPPPPIPRRPVKVRPQGKLVEDGSTADLPAVPRKTRTAILKRPQELFSPAVFDVSQQGSSAVSSTPHQASSLCSSAVVSTNVGRRTKPSGAKHRGTKVFKVSTPIASEQEVEVAEALFDLARMFSTQPTSLPELSLELQKPDPKSKTNPKIEPIAEPILNWEPDVLASSIFFPTSLFPSTSISTIAEFTAVSSSVTSMQTPTLAHAASLAFLPLGVMPLQCFPALGTVAVPVAVVSPSLVTPTSSTPVTASPAEAPKRKRPRVRTRPDEVGFPSHVGLPGNGSAIISQSCGITSLPIKPDPEQVLPIPPKAEVGKSPCAVSIVAQISTTMPPCVPLVLDPMDCSSPGAGHISHFIEGKAVPLEVEASKVNINNKSAMHDKRHIPQQERTITSASVPARTEMIMEAELPSNSISRHGASELELGKLATQCHIIACDGSGPDNFDIDLMAPTSVKRALLSAVEKAPECSQNPVKGLPKKGSMDIDEGKLREEEKGDAKQVDREYEGEGTNAKETELEVEINSEQLRGQEDQTELSKDTVAEKDQEGAEFVKPERPGSRVQRVGRAASMTSTALPFLSTCPPLASNVATSVTPVPLGMSGWPVGLQPMGFYSSAAAAGSCWPSTLTHGGLSSANDNSSGVQQPYVIQTHQPQPWKRCASHVYIAHFIDVQQQMHRHPFMQAAYQNSASLYGAKPYNLNVPLPHADTLLVNSPGGPLMSGVTGVRMVTGCGNGSALGIVPGSGRQLGALSLVGNSQMKDRAYGEVLSWNQVAQKQPNQLSPTLSLQADLGFSFPAAQTAAIVTCGMVGVAPVNGGSVGFPGSGGGSVIACSGSACGSTIVGSGASGAVASHSAAQAQYLQAVMHQGGYSFPFQAAVNGPAGYIVPQHGTSFFNNPSYTTHTVLPPSHGQLVQKYPHVSGGSMSLQRQQQLAVHNFTPCCPQEQSSLASPSHLSSHTQHRHGTMSHQMQHAVEREGSNGGRNDSTLEGNPSTSQRNVIDQGVLNATVDNIHPPASLAIGVHSLPPPDFNLMCTLGAKQAKQLQPGQLASQQQQLASQHHAIEHALQMTLKGVDQQLSQAVTAVGTMTRRLVIGPGPLGLAPVAAVMAPQGHAMLQTIADPSRSFAQHQQSQHHLSVSGLSHQQSLQLGQKQAEHRGPVLQRVSSDIGVCEESRLGLDGNSFASRCGREVAEDKKVSAKQGIGSTNLSRVDPDSLTSIQGSSCGMAISRMIGSVGPTLNLMAPASAVLISCPSVQVVGSDLQHSCPKEVLPQGKLLAASIGAALGPTSQSHLSFSDRASLGPSMCNKSPGPSLSLSGQYVDLPSSAAQHSQLKISIRGALGSLPTVSGFTPQTMLAAAVVKSKQGPHQQQARMQAQAEANAGTLIRIPPIDSGGSHSSMGIPLPTLPPVSKPNPSSSSKSISMSKNSSPNPHKPSNGVPNKKSTPPSVFVPHVSSTSCLSPLVQHPASQNHHSLQSSFQQQQQNVSQYHVQPLKSPQQPSLPPTSQLCLPQSLTATQYHQVHNKHIVMQHQQTQQIQRNVFIQSPALQQLQQAPGSPLNAHTLHHQKSSASSPQVQVRSSSPLILPQQQSQPIHNRQQYSVQNGPGVFSGPASRGNLSLSHPTLSLGTGSHGNSSTSLSSSPDNLGVSQGPGSRPSLATSKVTCGLGTSTFNLQRNQRSGQSFLHSQFGSKLPSLQQQPQIIAALQNSQAFVNSGASGKVTEQTATSDATGQEQVNGTRMLPSSCPLHLPQMSAVFQPVSMRSPTGAQSAVESSVEGTGTWSSSMLSVSPSLSSSNCLQNSNIHCNSGATNTSGLSSNVRSCSDGTPLFGVPSSVINQATIAGQSHSGSTHQ